MFPFPFLSCLHPPRGSPVSSPSAGPRPEPCSPPALLPPGLASGLPHLDLPGPPVWKPVSRAGPAAGLGRAAPGARARRGPTTHLARVRKWYCSSRAPTSFCSLESCVRLAWQDPYQPPKTPGCGCLTGSLVDGAFTSPHGSVPGGSAGPQASPHVPFPFVDGALCPFSVKQP